jgi:predicted GIY-YIG superfamily endonuclease
MRKSRFVYIISLGYGSLFKIGKTSNFKRRLKDLTSANIKAHKVKCTLVWDADSCERRIHERYKKQNIKREIFRLNRKDLNSISHFINQQTEAYLFENKDQRYMLSLDRIEKFGSDKYSNS